MPPAILGLNPVLPLAVYGAGSPLYAILWMDSKTLCYVVDRFRTPPPWYLCPSDVTMDPSGVVACADWTLSRVTSYVANIQSLGHFWFNPAELQDETHDREFRRWLVKHGGFRGAVLR